MKPTMSMFATQADYEAAVSAAPLTDAQLRNLSIFLIKHCEPDDYGSEETVATVDGQALALAKGVLHLLARLNSPEGTLDRTQTNLGRVVAQRERLVSALRSLAGDCGLAGFIDWTSHKEARSLLAEIDAQDKQWSDAQPGEDFTKYPYTGAINGS